MNKIPPPVFKVERSSNFELLRIVAMIMILNLHTFYPVDVTYENLLNGNLFVDYVRESLSIVGPNLFVLLSGYFGIKWKTEKFIWIIFETLFFVLVIYLVAVILGHTEFGLMKLFYTINVLPRRCYWFISVYLLLYLVAPAFNAFCSSVSVKQFRTFLILFFFFQFYYALFGEKEFDSGYSLASFIGIYCVGRYIRMNEDKSKFFNLKRKNYLLISMLLILLIAGYVISIRNFGHKDHHFTVHTIWGGLTYNNPLVLLLSLTIFMYFSKLKFQNKLVNYIGASALSVYLLHRSPDIKPLFNSIGQHFYDYNYLIHIFLLVSLFVIVFLIAIPMDKICLRLYNSLCKIINKRINATSSEKV